MKYFLLMTFLGFNMALLSQARVDAETITKVIDSQYLNPLDDKVGDKT